MIRIYAIAALSTLAVLGTGIWIAGVGSGDDPFGPCRSTTIAGGAGAIGGPFELVSENGETVTESEVIDGPTLIYFGYTFCPDICPYDAARNADAVDLVEAETGTAVTPVFVTIDPERDTPEVLAAYTDYLHPDMLGLTGSEAQLREARDAYKVYAARRESDTGHEGDYLMDHTGFSYLMMPEHGFVEVFRGATSLTAEDLAEELGCFINEA